MKHAVVNQNFIWRNLLLFLLLGIVGCKREQSGLSISQMVKTTDVIAWKGVTSVTYPGKLKASQQVKLSFRVPGLLKSVYVHEGEMVKKGALLAELDPRDYRLQYEAAQAEYAQVTEEAGRIIELYRRGAVSVNEYDKAVAAQKRVTANYKVAQNTLNDTRLKAPFDGYIQNRYFHAPEIVNQGTPVLSMLNNQPLEVDVELSARDFLRRSDFVDFYAVADVDSTIVSPLELLDINAEANYNQLFTAHFRLKEGRVSGLAPGMSVSVTIRFRPDTIQLSIIPISALFQRGDSSFVWRYDAKNQTVHAIKVQVDQLHKDGSVWIKSDLQPGQKIVSVGVDGLKEGQSVRLLPSVSQSNVGSIL